jgi:hypothetical protein
MARTVGSPATAGTLSGPRPRWITIAPPGAAASRGGVDHYRAVGWVTLRAPLKSWASRGCWTAAIGGAGQPALTQMTPRQAETLSETPLGHATSAEPGGKTRYRAGDRNPSASDVPTRSVGRTAQFGVSLRLYPAASLNVPTLMCGQRTPLKIKIDSWEYWS